MKYIIERKMHSDFSVFEKNKLKARSYFIPFSSKEELTKTDCKTERCNSDRVRLLSGQWDFKYYHALRNVPEVFDTQKESFDSVNVPSTWQRTGYDQIAYINTRYPFPKRPPHIPSDVAVGIYRKTVSFDKLSDKSVLCFLGVAGALSVYINASFVGYSEGSHNTAEFDVSDFLKQGDNEIVAVVYKWSNGTYLECQDMFRENGIFRDVYVIEHEKSYINDFVLRSSKNSDGTYDLKISVDAVLCEGAAVEVSCDGLFSVDVTPGKDAFVSSLEVKEWTAETPELYEVIFTVKKGGSVIEVIRQYYGFKDIKIVGEVFTFNGKAIKMLGVNHHDTHMTKGYAVSLDDLENDILLMKEYNCNTVRTSHYPPDPAFLTMCDIYGLYVVDEADIETHGFYSVPGTYRPGRLSNDLKWAEHYLDRVVRMYERDKNHVSVTMWSLGNESGGYKCQDECYDFLNRVNSEIPVHYEGVNRSKRWAYDVVSRMYASQSQMRKMREGKAGDRYKGKPFFQCEYAHAMGNGPGGLEEYVQLFYSSELFLGGCIWEWADHSVYDETAKYKYSYGGDHNERIHDGNFCVDGLFYPDRRPSSGALEMKACYRPIRAKYLGEGKIELWNTRSFKSTDDIEILFEVSVDSNVINVRKLDVVLDAQERRELSLDFDFSVYANSDIFVNVIYNRKIGGEIAREQLVVDEASFRNTYIFPTAKVTDKDGFIKAEFKNGSMLFDKKKGLVSFIKDGREVLNQNATDFIGFVPHISRGRIDNDQKIAALWNVSGLERAKPVLTFCETIRDGDGKFVRTKYNLVTDGVFVLACSDIDYHFDSEGNIRIDASLKKISPLATQLPRFGVHVELSAEFNETEYFGRGETENYSDFKEHALIGRFKENVSSMAHKYIKPQDSGNRGDVRWSSLSASDGQKLTFKALKVPFNFNANHFTLSQLKKAKHIEDLPDTETTFVSIDGFVRGSGSGSCGPNPSKEHLINFGYTKPLNFSFVIEAK